VRGPKARAGRRPGRTPQRERRPHSGLAPNPAAAFGLISLAAIELPAIAALALVASVWLILHAYELIHWREERARRRSADGQAQPIETGT
jgi:hypothetical protein